MEEFEYIEYDDYEIQYYNILYEKCRQGGQIEGKRAVEFLFQSDLSKEVLREIWEVASVYKQSYLTKSEFFIALKCVALAQLGHRVNKQNLKNNISKIRQPVFKGIPMPQRVSNPFDNIIQQMPQPQQIQPQIQQQEEKIATYEDILFDKIKNIKFVKQEQKQEEEDQWNEFVGTETEQKKD